MRPLDTLSNEELMSIAGISPQQQAIKDYAGAVESGSMSVSARRDQKPEPSRSLEGLSNEELMSIAGIAPISDTEPETTVSGLAASAARGAAPVAGTAAIGAGIGAGIGALAGGVGAIPGAAIGAQIGAAVPAIGDLGVAGINALFKTNYSGPTDAWQHLLTAIGVPEAKTQAERILQATVSAGAGSGGLAKGAGQLAKAASGRTEKVLSFLADKPIQQAVSGAAGGAAGQTAAEMGAGPKTQLAASLIGGMGASKAMAPRAPSAAGIAETTIKAAEGGRRAMGQLAEAAAPSQKVAAAAERLGVTEYLTPDLTSPNPQFRTLGQAVSSAPNSKLKIMQERGLNKIGEAADEIIRQLGGTRDLAQLSTSIRAAMKKTGEQLKEKADELYGALGAGFKKSEQVSPAKTMQAISSEISDIVDARALTPFEKRVKTLLTPKVRVDSDGVEYIVNPSYGLVDKLRREAGEAASGKGVFASESRGLAKKYYAALSDDINAFLDDIGLADDAMAAREIVKLRKGLESNMEELFGKDLKQSMGLSGAVGAVKQRDADKIINLINAIPEDMREQVVVSGIGSAFGRATENGTLNYKAFSEWWTSLMGNKPARHAILKSIPPEARRQIHDLAIISKSIADAQKKYIGTGRLAEALNAPDRAMAKIYKMAVRGTVGMVAGGAIEAALNSIGVHGYGIGMGIASGVASALVKNKSTALQAADELLVSPQFKALVDRAISDPTKFEASAFNALRNDSVMKRFVQSSQFKTFAESAKIPATIESAIDLFKIDKEDKGK